MKYLCSFKKNNLVINLFVILFFSTISFIAYQKLFFHGFTFEEWQTYGEIKELGSIKTSVFIMFSLPDLLLGKGRPIGTFFHNILIFYFENNPMPYAFLGILGHSLNGFLLFLISKKLLKNTFISFFSSLFFLTITISYESLSYFAATVQTVYSMFFYLLALWFLVSFLEKRKYYKLFLSILFAYISFLFREQTAYLIPFLIFFWLRTALKKKIYRLYIGIIFIILMTAVIFIIFNQYSSIYKSLYKFGEFIPTRSLLNALTYPILSLSHFLLPEKFIIRIGKSYISSSFPKLEWIPSHIYEFIYSAFGVEIISLLFSIPILLLILYGLLKSNKKNVYIFLIALYIASFFPIAIAQQQRGSGFLVYRYYYNVNPNFVLLMSICAISFIDIFKSKFKIHHRIYRITFIVFIILFFLVINKNISVIQREIKHHLFTSQRVRKLTEDILSAHPNIPNKPIFYIENGNDLFPNYGTGYMLALLYAESKKIPRSTILFTNLDSPVYYAKHIWKKDFEGYLIEENRAIGFFYRKDSLKSFLNEHPTISPDQIVGFSFNENGDIKSLSSKEIITALK